MSKKSIYFSPEVLDLNFQLGGVICQSADAGTIPNISTEQEMSNWEELL